MKYVFATWTGLFLLLFTACKVTFITGYDAVLDGTVSQVKKDFNLHFIKLSRVIQDNDPTNQQFANFQDYYDNLEANLILLRDRTKFLGGKAEIVKKQVANLDSVLHQFIGLHKAGLPDRRNDDRHDLRDGVNSAIDAVIILQESLKSTGKTAS